MAPRRKKGPSAGLPGKKKVEVVLDLSDYREIERAAVATSLPVATWVRMVLVREAKK